MKKKMTNKLDEMQEQKMLKIERNGCWFAFWGLFAALLIQVLIYGPGEWKNVVGEGIVFMCLALYIVVDCIRNGVWDRRISPTPMANCCVSLIAGIVGGILHFVLSYRKYHTLPGAFATGIVMGVITFALCFVALTCGAAIYRKRVKHLEQEDAAEDEGEWDGHKE